jgi:ubiquinone/menaquinone biosynthesis C-methylase UbiE
MNLPPNFNRLAPFYRWMEYLSFGPWLSRIRCTFLADLGLCRRALVLGDGDGRFTDRLLRTNPTIQIDAVDASAAMLNSLLRRAGSNAARVQTHLADARQWQPPARPYDLIVTHFFLDCLTTEEVQSLASLLRAAVSPSALWLVSEFSIPPGPFGRMVAHPLVAALYMAFGWLTGLTVRTLPDHRTALAAFGFTLVQDRTLLRGLLTGELWSAKPPDPL